MRWIKFAIWCYAALILQTGFLAELFPDGVRPMLFVVLANVVLLYWPMEQAIIGAWIIGLLADLTSIVPIGVMAFCFGVYGLMLVAIRPMIFKESPLAHTITASSGLIVIYFCYAVMRVFAGSIPPIPMSMLAMTGQIIVTGLLAGVVGVLIQQRWFSSGARRVL